MSRATVFIFCDDPSHSPRRGSAGNFRELPVGPLTPDGGWSQMSRRGRVVGTGQTMLGDEPAPDGWAFDAHNRNEDVRQRHELTCNRCPAHIARRTRVPARPENLFSVLDAIRDTGRQEVSLVELGAMLREQSERFSFGGP